MFRGFLLIFTLFSGTFGAKNASLLYNGQNKVMLSLEKPFHVEILSDQKVVATFDLPIANKSQVTGTQNGNDFELKIVYDKAISGINGSLDSAELVFGITSGKPNSPDG